MSPRSRKTAPPAPVGFEPRGLGVMLTNEITIEELLRRVSGGLIRTDRGNGSAGPVYLGERDDFVDGDLAATVRLVSEREYPDVWALARAAVRELTGYDGNPTHVAVDGIRDGYQAIYLG